MATRVKNTAAKDACVVAKGIGFGCFADANGIINSTYEIHGERFECGMKIEKGRLMVCIHGPVNPWHPFSFSKPNLGFSGVDSDSKNVMAGRIGADAYLLLDNMFGNFQEIGETVVFSFPNNGMIEFAVDHVRMTAKPIRIVYRLKLRKKESN